MTIRSVPISFTNKQYIVRCPWPDNILLQFRNDIYINDENNLAKSVEVFNDGFFFSAVGGNFIEIEEIAWKIFNDTADCKHHVLKKNDHGFEYCIMCGNLKVQLTEGNTDFFRYNA